MIEYNHLEKWESNSHIITKQAIGAVVSTERRTNDDWECMVFPVSKGDKIFITAQGGDDPRAVSILDDEYKMLYHSNAQEKTNTMLNVEQDGFVIVNNRKSTFTTPEVLHYPFSQDNTDLGRVYTTHNHGEDTTEEYQVSIGENVYPVVKIGNQLWTAKNLDENLGTLGVDEWYYNGRSAMTRLNTATTLSRVISSTSASDLDFTLYSGAGEYIVGNPVFVHFDVNISTPVDKDLNVAFYFKYGSTYYNSQSFTIQSGNTSVTANTAINIPANADTSSISCFIRLNRSSVSFRPSSTTATVSNFRVFRSNVDGGAGAITWEQALANEETAKSNNYGRLYTWNNLNENISKLGLSNWRVLNKEDAQFLASLETNEKNLRLVKFGGKDSYGLGFGGAGYYNDGFFHGNEQSFRCWTSDSSSSNLAWQFGSNDPPAVVATADRNTGRSIRLVLDIPEDGSLPDGIVKITHDKGPRNVGKGYIQDNNYQPGDFNVNEQITLLDKYGVTKIGNQLWTTENLDEELGTLGVDEWYYNGRSNETRLNDQISDSKAPGVTYNDLYFAIYDTDYIKEEVAKFVNDKTLYVTGKCSIDIAQTTDVSSPIYISYRTAESTSNQYLILGQAVIPAGQTECTINISRKLPNNIVSVNTFFIRVGNSTSPKSYWFYVSDFAIGLSNNVLPTNVSFNQALANEETAKSNNYGRLYNYVAATAGLAKLGLKRWRVPIDGDVDILADFCGGRDIAGHKLLSKNANGTDDYGFSGILSGEYSNSDGFVYGNERFVMGSIISEKYNYNVMRSDRPRLSSGVGASNSGMSLRLVLDLNEDGSYPEDATPLKLRETYKPYNRNIGTGAKPYIPNDNGKVYVDDVRCDIVCPHDKPETNNSISLTSETTSEPIIEE